MNIPFTITGVIIDIHPSGDGVKISVDCAGSVLRLIIPATESGNLHPGQKITITSTLLNPEIKASR